MIIISKDCVDIISTSADPTRNFFRVRFRNPKLFVGGKYSTPQWGQKAAMTIGTKYYGVKGCKITMAQPVGGRWMIQNVLIPKNGGVEMTEELALQIANHIQDRIEREGQWTAVMCRDNETKRYISKINGRHIERDERGRFAPHAAEEFGAEESINPKDYIQVWILNEWGNSDSPIYLNTYDLRFGEKGSTYFKALREVLDKGVKRGDYEGYKIRKMIPSPATHDWADWLSYERAFNQSYFYEVYIYGEKFLREYADFPIVENKYAIEEGDKSFNVVNERFEKPQRKTTEPMDGLGGLFGAEDDDDLCEKCGVHLGEYKWRRYACPYCYSEEFDAEKFEAEALVIPDGDSVPHHILYRLDREDIKYRFIEGDYGAEEFGAEERGKIYECSCGGPVVEGHVCRRCERVHEIYGRDYTAEEFKAESFRVGDEGMFEGGEVRITSIEDNSEDGRQNVYFFTYLDEEGNSEGFTHTSGERKFLNQFSMFPRDWNAEGFGVEEENCPKCSSDNIGKEEMPYCYTCGRDIRNPHDECYQCGSDNMGEEEMDYCYNCGEQGFWFDFGAEEFGAEQTQYDVKKGKDGIDYESANYISLHDTFAEAEAVAKRERKNLNDDEVIFIVEESFDDETFALDTNLLLSMGKSQTEETSSDSSFDAEEFEAQQFYNSCSTNQFEIFGRNLFYKCSNLGSVRSQKLASFNDGGLGAYRGGDYALRLSGGLSEYPIMRTLSDVSNDMQPSSMEDWKEVVSATNQIISATKAQRRMKS